MLATQERIVSKVEYQCARESMELIQRLPLEAQRKFLNMLQGAVTLMDVQKWPDPTRHEVDSGSKAVSDTYDRGGPLWRDRQLPAAQGIGGRWRNLGRGTSEHGGGEWRTAESRRGGGYDGLPDWMDAVRAGWADGSWELGIPRVTGKIPDRANRLKCLGNAVVPAQFYPIFKAIHDLGERKTCK